MVTTRRQEQQQAAVAQPPQQQQEPEGTPAAARPTGDDIVSPEAQYASPISQEGFSSVVDDDGQQQHQYQQQRQQQPPPPPQLKSALKVPRPPAGTDAGELRGLGWEDTTPFQAVKKRVRIHSGNNIVHVFGGSSSGSRHALLAEEEADGDTPQSRLQRRRGRGLSGTLGTPRLLHYQAFIRGVMGQGGAADAGGAGTQAAGGAQAQPASGARPLPALLPWAAVAATLLWMLCSSLLIFANKAIMVDRGFRYPFALTALGQAVSTVLGWLVGRAGLVPMRQQPRLAHSLPKLLPVAFCSAATLFLGNSAYLGLSVAFINILKALTPAVTLIASMALGMERPSLRVMASLGLIALGTSIATAQESATSHFSWLAFTGFMLSIVFEALRVVFAERLLGSQGARYNPMEVLVYIGPLIVVFLAAGALATERRGLWEEGFAIMAAHPAQFLGATVISFLVNAFSFFAIQTSSSLTFKVAGCLKNAGVVWMGVALGDELTLKEGLGYGLSLLGFLAYTLLRAPAAAAAAAARGGGAKRA